MSSCTSRICVNRAIPKPSIFPYAYRRIFVWICIHINKDICRCNLCLQTVLEEAVYEMKDCEKCQTNCIFMPHTAHNFYILQKKRQLYEYIAIYIGYEVYSNGNRVKCLQYLHSSWTTNAFAFEVVGHSRSVYVYLWICLLDFSTFHFIMCLWIESDPSETKTVAECTSTSAFLKIEWIWMNEILSYFETIQFIAVNGNDENISETHSIF